MSFEDLWLWMRLLLMATVAIMALHRLQMLWRLLRFPGRAAQVREQQRASAAEAEWPAVTVQLPIYNERFVVERLLRAVAALEYPREKLQIQILDDSDDETSVVIDSVVRAWGDAQPDLQVQVLRRLERTDFKAGALRVAMAELTGGLVAVLDADFRPDSDWLLRLVPDFCDSPRLGMVQSRWGFLNVQENGLTRVQAWFLDAHFRVEQESRWRSGCGFNFNGTAGIWRRECIDDAGGWQGDTLTEDLDLSYRALNRGWRFGYRDDVVVRSELPARWSAFLAQQFRWAKGSVQTARKLLPELWCREGKLSFAARCEATFHLTANGLYLVFFLLLAMAAGGALASGGADDTQGADPSGGLHWVGALALGVGWLFFAVPGFFCGVRTGKGWRDGGALLWTVPVAIGLAVNNARAVLQALRGQRSEFVRTPKEGGGDIGQGGGASRYRSRRATGQAVATLVPGIVFLVLLVFSASVGRWVQVALILPAAAGFLRVAVGSLREILSGGSGEVEMEKLTSAQASDGVTQKSRDISLSI